LTPSSYDGESEVVMTINRLSMPENKKEIREANRKALAEYSRNIDRYKAEAEYLEYVVERRVFEDTGLTGEYDHIRENGTWGAEAVVYPGHNERW